MAHVIQFDTLRFVKELATAGFSQTQAEAQAKALTTVLQGIEEARTEELATKRDLKERETSLKIDMNELKNDLKELEYRLVIKIGGMILAGNGLFFGIMRAWPIPFLDIPPPIQEHPILYFI